MSKGKKGQRKSGKKEPQRTLKEKRADKAAKKKEEKSTSTDS